MNRAKFAYCFVSVCGLVIAVLAILFLAVPSWNARIYQPDYEELFLEHVAGEIHESNHLPILVTSSLKPPPTCAPSDTPQDVKNWLGVFKVLEDNRPLVTVFDRVPGHKVCVSYHRLVKKNEKPTGTSFSSNIVKAFGKLPDAGLSSVYDRLVDLTPLHLERLGSKSQQIPDLSSWRDRVWWTRANTRAASKKEYESAPSALRLKAKIGIAYRLRLHIISFGLLPSGLAMFLCPWPAWRSFRKRLARKVEAELEDFPQLSALLPGFREYLFGDLQILSVDAQEEVQDVARAMRKKRRMQPELESLDKTLKLILAATPKGSVAESVISQALQEGDIKEMRRLAFEYKLPEVNGKKRSSPVAQVPADHWAKFRQWQATFSLLAVEVDAEAQVMKDCAEAASDVLEKNKFIKRAIDLQRAANRARDLRRAKRRSQASGSQEGRPRVERPVVFIDLKKLGPKFFDHRELVDKVPERVSTVAVAGILLYLADLGAEKGRFGQLCRSRTDLFDDCDEGGSKESRRRIDGALRWLVRQGAVIELLEEHERKYSIEPNPHEASKEGQWLVEWALRKRAEFKTGQSRKISTT